VLIAGTRGTRSYLVAAHAGPDANHSVAHGAGRAAFREALETVVRLLNPFTPHISEEMWARLGHTEPLVRTCWPAFDAETAREDEVELAVQVNGRVRGRITVPRGAGEEEVRAQALECVADQLKGRAVMKVVVVPGRLVSVVVG